MGLSDRLRRLDDRVLPEPAQPAPATLRTQRRYLVLAILGLALMVLAVSLMDDESYGFAIGLLALAVFGGPYFDLRFRRWMRR